MAERVFQHLHKLLADVYSDFSYIPLVLGKFRQIVGHLQAQAGLAGRDGCVGKIRGETRLIIIIAVVAEQSGYAVALCVKSRGVKRRTALYFGLILVFSNSVSAISGKPTY